MPSTSACRIDVSGPVAGPAAFSDAVAAPSSLSWQSSRALPPTGCAWVRAQAGQESPDISRSDTEAAAERFATLTTPHAHDPPPRSHHHPRRSTTKADTYVQARRAERVTAFATQHEHDPPQISRHHARRHTAEGVKGAKTPPKRHNPVITTFTAQHARGRPACSHHHARRRTTGAAACPEARRVRWITAWRSHRPRVASSRPAAAILQASTVMRERPRGARGHPWQARHRARRSTTGCGIRTTVHDKPLTAHDTPAVILGKHHHARRLSTIHGWPSIVRGRFSASGFEARVTARAGRP